MSAPRRGKPKIVSCDVPGLSGADAQAASETGEVVVRVELRT